LAADTSTNIVASAGAAISPVTLAFTKVMLPPALVPGARINAPVSVLITNGGPDLKGNYTVVLFTDATLDGSHIFITQTTMKLSLKTGKNKAFNFTLKGLPAAIANGTYHILAQVIDPNGATNSIASSQTVLIAPPFVQLAASAGIVKPASILVGKSGTISVVVTNNGNIDAVGPIDLELGLSSDGVLPVVGVTLKAIMMKNTKIKAGQSKTFKIPFKLIAGLNPGTFFPFFTISLDGALTTTVGSTSFIIT
jgi:hypothetical protein